MTFRQVPKPVPLDEQIIPSPVLDQATCRIDLAELSADLLVAILWLCRRNVDFFQCGGKFEHLHKCRNVRRLLEMEFHCIRV